MPGRARRAAAVNASQASSPPPATASAAPAKAAAVDGMRFVVAVPSIYARPNRKYFGPRRGITWLNMINDQTAGLGYKVVSGTPLNTAARGKIDVAKIRRHWPDILRVAASIYTGSVRAYDIVRALQRDSHPTPLGDAIACYGRIFKSPHILAFIDDEPYRRDIKNIRNLQEGRHSLAGKIFHGGKGQIYKRYHTGMEDQLGALGLVLNAVVLERRLHGRRPRAAQLRDAEDDDEE